MNDGLALESLCMGGQPLLRPFLKRLRVRHFIAQALGTPDPRSKLPPLDSVMLLLRNFTLSRHPLYGVPEWVRRFDPGLLDLDEDQIRLVNDDRLGRALDKLFKADLRTLTTRFVIHMVEAFEIDLQRMHNDSTSITFSGDYTQKPLRKDGRPRLKIVNGFNKDHRPDLKQLVWVLTVSADGAVPVHYKVYDGNASDDKTHVETWKVLCQIHGGPDFLYVADCKLCTRENMGYVDGEHGHFLTVLPRSRKEDAVFKKWIVDAEVPWEVIWDRPPLRRKHDAPERFEAVEDPQLSSEGYRIVWFRSSEKWKGDERTRSSAIRTACREIDDVRDRVGKRNLKAREQVQEAVDAILEQTKTGAWLRVEIVPRERHTHKQAGPGRPGKNTRYVRQTTVIYEPVVTQDVESIRASAAADGIFPYITNVSTKDLSPRDLLEIYKYQPFIEKRHEQLKTAADLTPVNLKTPERIEALLFLYFIATTIHALIERHVRNRMKAGGIRSIPLYPEERACRAPTANKILGLFADLRVHRLTDDQRPVKTFWDELTPAQRTVLEMLEIPTSAFGQ